MKKEKHSRILKLKCLSQVHELLASNTPLRDVAEFIQENGEITDVTQQGLAVTLGRYKKDMVANIISGGNNYYSELMERITNGLDEIVELGKLYEVQASRLHMALRKEKEADVTDKRVMEEMRFAKEILQTRRTLREKKLYDGDDGGSSDVTDRKFSGSLSALNDNRSKSRVLSAVVAIITQGDRIDDSNMIDLPAESIEVEEDDN